MRLGDIVRIDTGVALSGFFPVNGGNAIGGLAGISSSPTQAGVATAGLPVDVAFQVAEPVFLGINTGLGIGNFEKAGDSLFSPLGAFVGGTVASEDKALLDLKGTFSFPYFLLGSDSEPPLTQVGQVGLDARAYIDLGG